MEPKILNMETIVSDPSLHNGRPVIAGTDICVFELVLQHIHHRTAYYMAHHYELDLGQVYAALAFYYLNKEEIDYELNHGADREAWIETLVRDGQVVRFEALAESG